MSNSLAIAAVSATLQSILTKTVSADPDLNDVVVTLQPLDKARGTITSNQLNLFLYQVLRSPAWTNQNIPRQSQPGESPAPLLPLNLWYLVTAYGRDDDATQPFGHQLLGRAMSILNDHPILSPDDIRSATSGTLPRQDLDKQIERVRITLQPLSVEEISKLWTGFATQYRLSAAYEISVALIESTLPAKTPLPVLTRGQGDQGITSQTDLSSPFPSLSDAAPPGTQPSVKLGDTLTLTGEHLDGTNVTVVFNHPVWTTPVQIAIPPGPSATATAIKVAIPNAPTVWPAGFYTAQVMVQRPTETYLRSTNLVTFSLAPSLTILPASSAAGNIVYTTTSQPDVFPQQRASLLLGSQEILADAHAAQTNTLTFAAEDVVAGSYFVRLRVDGVDSMLVDRSVAPPKFDPTQSVTVT
jgi:Pvc16 N-terminal domain